MSSPLSIATLFTARVSGFSTPGYGGNLSLSYQITTAVLVARSKEAKALGIPMGAPAFKWKETFEQNSVFVYSSNYTLYGDLSRRVMEVLQQFSPEVEIYSIDEAFLALETDDPIALGQKIRARVAKWDGDPCFCWNCAD